MSDYTRLKKAVRHLTLDAAYAIASHTADDALAAGNKPGYYACNKILHAIHEARDLLGSAQPPQQKGLDK